MGTFAVSIILILTLVIIVLLATVISYGLSSLFEKMSNNVNALATTGVVLFIMFLMGSYGNAMKNATIKSIHEGTAVIEEVYTISAEGDTLNTELKLKFLDRSN